MVKQPTTIKSSGSVRPAHSHIVVVPKRVAATSSEEGRKEELRRVYLVKPGQPKPYQARVKRGGKDVHLGSFAAAEQAALCVARSPEGQAAAAER
jgi:hypothetical protein